MKFKSDENNQIRELEYVKKKLQEYKKVDGMILEEDISEEQQQNIREFKVKTINLRRGPLEKISEVSSSSSIASAAQGLFHFSKE
jgi:hypothetical protein